MTGEWQLKATPFYETGQVYCWLIRHMLNQPHLVFEFDKPTYMHQGLTRKGTEYEKAKARRTQYGFGGSMATEAQIDCQGNQNPNPKLIRALICTLI